jgi:hypothetical protein
MDMKFPQKYPYQGLPKYIKIGIFGLKNYHLATLIASSQGF